MTRITRRQYGMRLAEAAAARSEDPYRQVGAVITRFDGSVAAMGYNGAPPGVEIDWENRDERRLWVIHAEANALRYVNPEEAMTCYTTTLPCARCMLLLASYRVAVVVYRDDLDPTVDEPAYDPALIRQIAQRSDITIFKEA